MFGASGQLAGSAGRRRRGRLGSGFVLDGDGEIATNAHVVTSGEGAAIHRARARVRQFADGNQVPAKIVGDDPNADVALLRVDPPGSRCARCRWATAPRSRSASRSAAIGSPFGEHAVAVGRRRLRDRPHDRVAHRLPDPGAIQTDAAINRGNSGGPLVDPAAA